MVDYVRNLASGYAMQAKQHSALHYVPSFNDLNSCSADDADDMAQELRGALRQQQKQMANGQQPLDVQTKVVMSNKKDTGPAYETTDMHKVNRHDSTKGASFLYDNVKNSPQSLSIWEEILKSEKSQRKSPSA